MLIPVSSSQWSHDLQVSDVINYWLSTDQERSFVRAFPEWDELVWEGAHVNTAESDVDDDYMSMITDWIEAFTEIYWEDGEPWLEERETYETPVTVSYVGEDEPPF